MAIDHKTSKDGQPDKQSCAACA